MLAAWLIEWLVVWVHKLILDQSADKKYFPTADLELAGKQHRFFQILIYQQVSTSPFGDCRMSAQEFPSNLIHAISLKTFG